MRYSGWIARAIVLAYVSACIIACIVIPIVDSVLYSERPFDSERWRSGNTRQRARMVRDLKRSDVLIGKTHEEVLTLLGPSDPEMGSYMYEFVNGELIQDAFGISAWREWLVVRFDRDTGRVCDVTFFD